MTDEWWLVGVRRSRRSKKVEGKGDLIENIGASGSVLWKYESCIQNRVENFEVLEKMCVWIEILTALPKTTITKEFCTHLSVPSGATSSRDHNTLW